MIRIQKALLSKEKELREMIEKLEERLERSPQGSLRISRNKYGTAYYHCRAEENSQSNGTYIKKQSIDLARALAQKSYDKKLLGWARGCHVQVKKLLDCYQDRAVTEFYEKMPETRQQLIVPIEEPEQKMMRGWEKQQYEGKAFHNEDVFILTEKGERVRSKSEKILADKFFMKGIPYKYECPLRIGGYGIIYPDFTLLNVHTGEVFYWDTLEW